MFQLEAWVTSEDEMAEYLARAEAGDEPEEGPGREVVVTLMVDPMLDIVRLGASLGSFGAAMESMQDKGISSEQKLATLDSEVPRVKAALRQCLVPPSRLKFDTVSEAVDVVKIGETVRWLTQELSGLDPTQQKSSSNGAPEIGESSTAGVPPEA